MTHFPDGSPYSYSQPGEDGLVNVGWLDASQPFSQGDVPREFTLALAELCRHGVLRTRGLHRCNLCGPPPGGELRPPVRVVHPLGDYIVGGAEIRVNGLTGVRYAAPDLIIHYVQAHGYRPPPEFVEAVLADRAP